MSRPKKQPPRSSRAEPTLATPPAASTAEVIRNLQSLQASLPDSDGVKSFNALYLSVTLAVNDQIAKSNGFADPDWIARLDICFANLYFAALTAAQTPRTGPAPAAWQPLFQNRATPGIAPVQFALAGMNSHINRDLVAALLTMFAADGKAPGLTSARFRDYHRINQILERVETRMRPALLVGTPLAEGGHLAPLEDVLAMWSVTAARQAAWDHSQALWELRALKPVQQASFAALDEMTGLAGNGLLIRVLPPASRQITR